jgi:23S rRNA (adenine2503-C2)-methyltransferase
MNKDLKNQTLAELERIAEQFGQKKYLVGYIFSFIHKKNAAGLDSLTTLSKSFRQKLKDENYYISNIKILRKLTDPDGTIKYLFELPPHPQADKNGDGLTVESVLLFDDDRITLCASTQVGCAMDCGFCATGKIKFKRNLSAAEIADQVNVIEQDQKCRISNVVFMGMGEPLANYQNTLRAVRILNDPAGKNIGIRHLTISTCGLADKITKLADETIRPRLAVSLNAADNSLRSKLMPVNKRFPLRILFNALQLYQHKTRQRVTIEYVLIKGVNDSDEDARKLAALVRNIMCNINLIEFNPHGLCEFKPSAKQRINRFAQILSAYGGAGIETVIRFKRGTHISAACGQLGSEMRSV